MNHTFYLINKLGVSGTGLYTVTVVVGGALLRRVLDDPGNTPAGAIALPAGFDVREHTHSIGIPLLRPGVATAGVEPWNITNGDTLTVSVAGNTAQTATVQPGDVASLGAATAAEIAAVISRDITGATGLARSDGRFVIVADSDTDSIQVTGGTLNAVLMLDTSVQTGSINDGNQPYYHSTEADDATYQIDIVDPNQGPTDLAPTLRSWSEQLSA